MKISLGASEGRQESGVEREVSNPRSGVVTAVGSAIIFGLVAGICLWRGGIPSLTNRALCYSGFAAAGVAVISGVAAGVLGIKMCCSLKTNTMNNSQPQVSPSGIESEEENHPESGSFLTHGSNSQRDERINVDSSRQNGPQKGMIDQSFNPLPGGSPSASPMQTFQPQTNRRANEASLSRLAQQRAEQMVEAMKQNGILIEGCWQPPPEKDSWALQAEFNKIRPQLLPLEELNEGDSARCRYKNIRPYEGLRVPLSDGTFIDASPDSAGFIRTSGPLPKTIAAFWQMIWEQNSSLIVMLTNLKDGKQPKCDQYWPTNGKQTYGDIEITITNEEVCHQNLDSAYTVRTFIMSRNGEVRTVRQLHVTNWTDHQAMPVDAFGTIIEAAHSNQLELDQSNEAIMGPMVVHCSAGVGRTGTFCAAMMMRQAHQDNRGITTNGLLRYGREQRLMSIQTPEQYKLLHHYGMSLTS